MSTRKWKYPFVGRVNRNDSDCWCDALALATGKSYDEIWALFQPFLFESGSLESHFISGYLMLNGYERLMISTGDSVGDLFQVLDSRNNDIVIEIDDHVVYVSNNRIHDNVHVGNTSRYLCVTATGYYRRPKVKKQ